MVHDYNEIVTMGGVLSKVIKLQTLKNGGTPDLRCKGAEQTRTFMNIYEILRLGISAGCDPEKVALGDELDTVLDGLYKPDRYVLGREVIAFLRVAVLGDMVYVKDTIKTIHANVADNSVEGTVCAILESATYYRDHRIGFAKTPASEVIELCDFFSALYWLYSRKDR